MMFEPDIGPMTLTLTGKQLKIVSASLMTYEGVPFATVTKVPLSAEEAPVLNALFNRAVAAQDSLYLDPGKPRTRQERQAVMNRSVPFEFSPVELKLTRRALDFCLLAFTSDEDARIYLGGPIDRPELEDLNGRLAKRP
jgi:hypothetical protein